MRRHETGMDGQRHAPAALLPGKKPGTDCTGAWVDPRAGLNEREISRPHRDLFFRILLFSVLYFIRTCFFVLNALHLAVLSLLTTHNINIHTPGGIRTRNPSRRAAADLRLRPQATEIGPAPLYSQKEIEGWVCPRAGLEGCETSRPQYSPARSE